MKMFARLTPLHYVLIASSSIAAACSSEPKPAPAQLAPSVSQHVAIGQLPALDLDQLMAHTRKLSSDEFAGRAPGTNGEQLSVTYLANQFKAVGNDLAGAHVLGVTGKVLR